MDVCVIVVSCFSGVRVCSPKEKRERYLCGDIRVRVGFIMGLVFRLLI